MNWKTYVAVVLVFLPISICAVEAQEPTAQEPEVQEPEVQEPEQRVIEEVIVTAQKRSQSIQDVPISISAISGDTMEARQQFDFEALVPDLPNVEFISSPGLDKALGIRGLFTATSNPAFEQSVGVFSDGVYVPRGRLYDLTFTDVERIEVLRGPQGVLNGKNSIAGAINIHSRKPTKDFEAGGGLSNEFQNGGYSGEVFVSGPMTDKLSGRAFVKYQKIGGYLDFPRTGRTDQNESDFLSFKGSLLYEPTANSSLLLRYDRQEAEQLGMEFGTYRFQASVADDLEAFYRSDDPDFDFVTNDVISNGRLLRVDEQGNVTASNERPFAGTDIDTFEAKYDWGFSNGGEFTSITSYLTYSSYGLYAHPMRPVDFLTQGDEDEEEGFGQFTQELRYVSPAGETIDYLAGLYYLSSDLDIRRDDSVVSAAALGYPDEWNFLPIENFVQETESISVFGQATWNITDRFNASLGLRYTNEDKQADGSMRLLSTDRSQVVGGQEPGSPGFNPIADLFATNYVNTGKRTEESWDPSFVFRWHASDTSMLYASWTQATKAGGFVAGDLNGLSFEYDEEKARSVEVGAKQEFLNNRFRWNMAVFSTEFRDLQVSAWDANVFSFVTKNAAKATVRGLESDLIYVINRHWTLGGAVGYLDAKYDDYPGASCSVGESREADCAADETRNAAGDELRQAPEWTANAYVDFENELSNGLSFGLRLTVDYSDSYFMSATNDPYLRLDPYTKTDTVVWLGSVGGNWKLSLLGKNLSDERVPFFANNTPLIDGAYFSSVQAGRELFLNLTFAF